jgi:hypothetical protein
MRRKAEREFPQGNSRTNPKIHGGIFGSESSKLWTAKSFAVIEPVEMTINTKCGGFDKLNYCLFAMTRSTTAFHF